MKTLRAYQVENNRKVRAAEDFGPVRLNVQSPTGSGKTVMMADLLTDPMPQGVLTHRCILFDMLRRVLTEAGIPFGMRAAGYKPDYNQPIQICMAQTEWSRTFKKQQSPVHKALRWHIDEIHAQQGDNTFTMLQKYRRSGSSIITWTATPQDIGAYVDHNIIAAQVHELIAAGYLVPPQVFGPSHPDMEKLDKVKRQVNGEYSLAGLENVWDSKVIFGNVLENLLLLNPELKPTILFAQGIPHSLFFAQQLTAHGIRSAHIDGDDIWVDGKSYSSDSKARQEIFDRSQAGDIKVICNRFVMREGVDLPWLCHCINACVFGTRKTWVQANGRILRPYENKSQAVIQDHGGNYLRFPDLDASDPWELGVSDRVAAATRIDNIRDGKILEPICCSRCRAVRTDGDTCPVCGFKSSLRQRAVVQVNGELKLVTGSAYRKQRIVKTKDDAATWKGLYHGNLKYHPERTPSQIRAYHAYKNDWKWLPKDLPMMPLVDEHWHIPVKEIPREALR